MKRPTRAKSPRRSARALATRQLHAVTGGGGDRITTTTQVADFNRDGILDVGAL